jgi:hypothetical protein
VEARRSLGAKAQQQRIAAAATHSLTPQADYCSNAGDEEVKDRNNTKQSNVGCDDYDDGSCLHTP